MTVKQFTDIFHRSTKVSIRTNRIDGTFNMYRQIWYGDISLIPDEYEDKNVFVSRVENNILVIYI